VYGRRIDLAEAGFAMRDIESGDAITLSEDGEVLKRLTEGWIPAGAVR
jgi:hypothetical protein